MRRPQNEVRLKPVWWKRAFHFWLPIMLFCYFLFVQIIWRLMPVHGPVAWLGEIIPVPIGHIDHGPIIFYGRALKIESWYKELGVESTPENIRKWVLLSAYANKLSKETGGEKPGADFTGLPEFRGADRELLSLQQSFIINARIAATQGKYQDIAQARVAEIQALIDLKINFPDLALQYSELPSASLRGYRELLPADAPTEYATYLQSQSKDIQKVETADHYVFLRNRGQTENYQFDELGVPKQNFMQTLQVYITHHPFHWY